MRDGGAKVSDEWKEPEKLDVVEAIAHPKSELGIVAHPVRQPHEIGVTQHAVEIHDPLVSRKRPQHLGRQR